MDYCMPRADNLPSFKVDYSVTACTHNDLGVKGCGEAGAIASPPAVINAVMLSDGLWNRQLLTFTDATEELVNELVDIHGDLVFHQTSEAASCIAGF